MYQSVKSFSEIGRVIGSLGIFVMLAVVNPIAARADILTSDQMFLDPWSVPLIIHPRDELSPLITGNSIQWDSQITDVDILPMLKPYSPGDPAGYALDYSFTSADYYYTPVTDYFVDLTAGVATATFNKEGIYHARLTRGDGSSEIRAVLVNAGTLGGDQRTAASVPISGPKADLVLVSEPTGGDATLEKANSNAIDDNGASKVGRASSVADAVAKIKAAYEKNGNKKFHLEIVAHGSPGYFELGDTRIGQGGTMTIKEFQGLIDKYVNEISIFACSFAADGKAGLQTLADSIGYAWGYDKPISVYRSWFGLSYGWDLSLRGQTLSAVPEPAPVFIMCLGIIILGGGLKRQEIRAKRRSCDP